MCVRIYFMSHNDWRVHRLHAHTQCNNQMNGKKVDNNGTQNGMPSVEYMIIIHNGSASSDWAFFTIEIQRQQRSSQPNTEKNPFCWGWQKRLAKCRWMADGGNFVIALTTHTKMSMWKNTMCSNGAYYGTRRLHYVLPIPLHCHMCVCRLARGLIWCRHGRIDDVLAL